VSNASHIDVASVGELSTTVSLRGHGAPVAAAGRSRVTESTRSCVRACCVDGDANIGSLLGNYRLLERIGEGGMGQVYLAEHVRLGRRVALKVLRHELTSRPSAVARFLREARIVSRIRHLNVVQVEDLIEPDGGPPCLVMELLCGQQLRDLLRARGALDPSLVVEIGIQICSALEAIHAAGVLHRDLTPGNVYVCDDRDPGEGGIKLLDFGVAKLFGGSPGAAGGEPVEHVTAEGAIIGTPGYMSPEQACGGAVDARSDLYSLGVLLYELASGEPVVTGRSFGECVRAHIADAPRPLQVTRRGRSIPPALAALVMRCLAKRPDERPPSASALRAELLVLRDRQIAPPAPRSAASLAPALAIAVALAAGAVRCHASAPGPPTTAAVGEADRCEVLRAPPRP